MDNILLLKSFANMIAVPLSNTDNIKWPVRSGQVISCVSDIYALEYMHQLHVLTERYPVTEWKDAFTNSLNIWKVSHHVVNGLCKAKLSKDEIANEILLITNVLFEINNHQPFISDSHKILTNKEIDLLWEKYQFLHEQDNIITLVQLSTLFWAYSDSLFFQGREVCCEYHGVYDISQDNKLLIIDIKDINIFSELLWKNDYKSFSFSSIRIVLIYNKDFNITIDAYNNIDLLSGSFISSCKGGLLLIDGKPIFDETANKLSSELLQRIRNQTRLVNDLTQEELYSQYIRIFWLRKKKLADKIGESWKADNKVFDILRANSGILQNSMPKCIGNYSEQFNKYDYSQYLR